MRLVAYDALGRRVAVLVNEARSAGRHHARLDATNLASGVYVVHLTAKGTTTGAYTQTRRVVLVK